MIKVSTFLRGRCFKLQGFSQSLVLANQNESYNGRQITTAAYPGLTSSSEAVVTDHYQRNPTRDAGQDTGHWVMWSVGLIDFAKFYIILYLSEAFYLYSETCIREHALLPCIPLVSKRKACDTGIEWLDKANLMKPFPSCFAGDRIFHLSLLSLFLFLCAFLTWMSWCVCHGN